MGAVKSGPDGTAIRTPGRPKCRTAVIVQDDGPYRVRLVV